MCPASLVETVHALAKAGCCRLPAVLWELEALAAEAVRKGLKPRQTLTLVRGFRRARVSAPLLLKAATTAVKKREAEFSTKQLAQLLLAVVREGNKEGSGGADVVVPLRAAVSRRLESSRDDTSLTPQVLKFVLGAYLAADGADHSVIRAANASQAVLRVRAAELGELRMQPRPASAVKSCVCEPND